MAQLSLRTPTIGQPDSTEEPKVVDNFTAISTWANGRIATDNLEATAGILGTQLAAAAGITATQMGAGTSGLAAESFSAWRRTALSIPNGRTTVVPFEVEEWDVSSRYDTTTGRFTPQVAGYYRLSALAVVAGLGAGEAQDVVLQKNGAQFKELARYTDTPTGFAAGSATVLANGTTDYFDVVTFHTHASSLNLNVGQVVCYFQGELIGRS